MHNAATSPVPAFTGTRTDGSTVTFPFGPVQCKSDLPLEIRRDLVEFKLVDARAT